MDIAMNQFSYLCFLCFLIFTLFIGVGVLPESYAAVSSECLEEPHITIENDTARQQTIFYKRNFLVCKYGTIVSLEPEESIRMKYAKYGFKKLGIYGWKRKVRVTDGYYFVSELLLQALSSNEVFFAPYKESRTFRVINETSEEQRLTFTFFRDGRYRVTILLKPKEIMDVPYNRGAIHKRVCFENGNRTVEIKRNDVLRVCNSDIEVVRGIHR